MHVCIHVMRVSDFSDILINKCSDYLIRSVYFILLFTINSS